MAFGYSKASINSVVQLEAFTAVAGSIVGKLIAFLNLNYYIKYILNHFKIVFFIDSGFWGFGVLGFWGKNG